MTSPTSLSLYKDILRWNFATPAVAAFNRHYTLYGFVMRSIIFIFCFSMMAVNISSSKELGLNVLKNSLDYLVKAGECDNAWSFLWSLAKKGDKNAKILMASSIAAGVMIPKFLNEDNYIEYITLFSFYAVAADGKIARDNSEYPLHLLPDGELKRSMEFCFNLNASKSECIDRAIAIGLVPSFKKFVVSIDALNTEGGVCLRGRR